MTSRRLALPARRDARWLGAGVGEHSAWLDAFAGIRAPGRQVVAIQRGRVGGGGIASLADPTHDVLASLGGIDLHADVAIEKDREWFATYDRERVFSELDGLCFVEELRREVLELALAFGRVARRKEVHVSIEVIVGDNCPKWHVDRVGLRLLETWIGPGTEWALSEGVDRRWLGSVDGTLDAVNERIVFDPFAIRRAGARDVLLCKGDSYPGQEGMGLVHRSPRSGASPRSRLLVRIDERCRGA